MDSLKYREIFWQEFNAEGLNRDGLLAPTIACERAIVAAMRRAYLMGRDDANRDAEAALAES